MLGGDSNYATYSAFGAKCCEKRRPWKHRGNGDDGTDRTDPNGGNDDDGSDDHDGDVR